MAQAKKKKATRTKKSTSRPQQARRKTSTRTAKKQISQNEKMHVYIVTAMAIVAGALLCANAVMMIV